MPAGAITTCLESNRSEWSSPMTPVNVATPTAATDAADDDVAPGGELTESSHVAIMAAASPVSTVMFLYWYWPARGPKPVQEPGGGLGVGATGVVNSSAWHARPPRHSSSTPSARPSVGAVAGSSTVHPADLGAHAIRSLVERTGVDPGAVEDVVFGNLDSIGPQAGCIARTCWLTAGLPEHVPGVTVDRQCGSAQQAVHFAAQAVMSGTMDLVVAGGVQNMSMIPIGSAGAAGPAFGFADPYSTSPGWTTRYGTGEVSQFVGAEMIAAQVGHQP